MKSCFFIGHREASSELLGRLGEAIERHIIEYGVTEFIVGNSGGFDRVATKALAETKKRHPEIRLSMLIAYHPAQRPMQLPPEFDNSFYPPGMENVPRRFAILRANRYMADHCDYLIAYVWHTASKARELMEYAERKGISITNIAEAE